MRFFTALATGNEPRAGDLGPINGAPQVRRIIPTKDGFRRDWGEGPVALDHQNEATEKRIARKRKLAAELNLGGTTPQAAAEPAGNPATEASEPTIPKG